MGRKAAGNAILLNGTAQNANREMGVPGIQTIRFLPGLLAHGRTLLCLAVARFPHLIEKRLRGGIDGKIAYVNRLLALQIHDD
jgi:hypothetical protein